MSQDASRVPRRIAPDADRRSHLLYVFDNSMNLHKQAPQFFRKRAREKAVPRRDLAPGAGVLGAQPGSFRPGAGDSVHTLTHGGRERRFVVHVPRGYDGSRSLPVVLGFHGGGGRAESFQKQSRMSDVSDRHGFLVVYPDGTGRARLLTWNAGT